MAAHVGEEYGRSLAARMTPSEGQRTVRAAMHVVAETLTAHGFAAHAEDRGDDHGGRRRAVPLRRRQQHQPRAVRGGPRHGQGTAVRAVRHGVAPGAPGDPLVAGAGRRRLHRLCLSLRWRAPISTTPARPRRGPRRSPPWRTGPRLPTGDPGPAPRRGPHRPRRARGGPRRRWRTCVGVGGPPGRLHLGGDRGHQRGRLGRDPRRAGRARAVRRRGALGGPRRLGARWRRPRSIGVDGAGRLDVDGPAGAPAGPGAAPPGAGALPVGQPRGGDAPARARGGRAVPGRPGSRSTSTPRRPAATCPWTSARWTPTWSASVRTSSAGVPGRRRADRAARQPVRTPPRRAASRSAGAGPGSRRSRRSSPSVPRPPRWPARRSACRARRRPRAPGDRSPPSSTPPLAVERGRRRRARPPRSDRLPYLVCLGVHGVEAEPVLIGLDRAGVAVHSGSACSSESIEPSPVLEAMGVDPSHSLRVSVGWSTTDDGLRRVRRRLPPGRRRPARRYGADVAGRLGGPGRVKLRGSGTPAAL